MKRAFTLIELLVVIAIIAILAAILFPVFAQAKVQAKKIADLSNLKQTATAHLIYTNDADDLFPLGYRFTPQAVGSPNGTWRWNFNVSLPLGWMGPNYAQGQPARMAEDASHWSNTITPYTKNYGLHEGPGLPTVDVYGYPTSGVAPEIQKPQISNMTYNGLLHSWSTTAIASPSMVPLVWGGRGKGNADGAALSNPALYCPLNVSAGTCLYNSGNYAQPGTGIGGYMFVIYTSMWEYTKGANFSFTDSSAKYRTLGGTLAPGNTNALVDPYTQYDVNGNPTSFWVNCINNNCNMLGYPYIFRPDFNGT